MAANICWAQPEVTECWSFGGRLYMSLKKAEFEVQRALKLKEKHKDRFPHWAEYVPPPIHHIKWEWEEV